MNVFIDNYTQALLWLDFLSCSSQFTIFLFGEKYCNLRLWWCITRNAKLESFVNIANFSQLSLMTGLYRIFQFVWSIWKYGMTSEGLISKWLIFKSQLVNSILFYIYITEALNHLFQTWCLRWKLITRKWLAPFYSLSFRIRSLISK